MPTKTKKTLKNTRKVTAVPKPPKNGNESVADAVATELEVAAPVTVKYKYREFKPLPLPQQYKYMTPKWLYSSLIWEDRVRELRPNPKADLRHKLQIGATVAVLISFGVIVFLAMAIVAG